MTIPTLPGVTPKTIATDRITTRVLFSGPDDGAPVLFLHGNASSATWWEETMLALPAGYRGIAPDQRGFGEADLDKKVDATRGAGDWADDAAALLDALGIDKVHVVGNSLGGVVVWRLLADCPQRLLTATLVDPGSPYGFSGTKDEQGTPCYDDYAGSGAGLIGAAVVEAVKAGDRSLENPFGYRSGLRRLVFKPPFVPAREEELLSASLSIHTGERGFPGDKTSLRQLALRRAGHLGRSQRAVAQICRRGRAASAGRPAQAAAAVGARQPRPERVRQRGRRRGHAGRAGLSARLARHGGLSAPAHASPDEGRAGAIRRGRRLVPRGGDRRRRPCAVHRKAG
ncbi:MAG: alpha/beta fold hydrolase [Anaerolineae bacterium]